MSLLLLIIVSLLLLPVVLEIIARVMIRNGSYYPSRPHTSVEMTLDPRLKVGDQKVTQLRVNSRGERGNEVDEKAFQVLAVGGSAVECYLLDERFTWSGVIEQRLQDSGIPHVRVGNTGKSSVDSYVLARMLKCMKPNYRKPLDVLLIMVGASDILTWLQKGAPAEWEGDKETPLEAFLEENPEIVLGFNIRTLALAEMWRRMRARRPQQRANVGKSLLKARKYRQQATQFLEQTTDPAAVFTRFERFLRDSIQNGREFSRRVIVMSQPCFTLADYSAEEQVDFWNGSIGDPYQGEPTGFYSARVIADLMQQLRDHSRVAAEAEGVEFVDLSSGAVPNDREHYFDQFHFTPRGAAKVGELMTRVILSKQVDEN